MALIVFSRLPTSLVQQDFLASQLRYPQMCTGSKGTIQSLLDIRAGMFDLKSFKRFHAHYKLDLFDVISPRWTSVHAENEVILWFTSQGFLARKVGYGDYVGIKAGIGEVLHNGMNSSK